MKTLKRFLSFLLSAILLMSSVPAFTLTASAAERLAGLQAAAASFEAKMSDFDSYDFYTGTKRAYDAYVVVNRYIDAITCGETSLDATLAVYELNSAVAAMQGWSFKTANAHASFAIDDTYVTDDYYNQVYKNIIWGENLVTACEDRTEEGWDGNSVLGYEETVYSGGAGNKNSIRPVLYHPSVVMLYDGITTPSTSVMYRSRRYKGSTGYCNITDYATYINSNAQGLYLNDSWCGVDSRPNFQYTYFTYKDSERKNNNGRISHQDSFTDIYNFISNYLSGETRNRIYANVLYFDGTFTQDSPYARTITGVEWGFKYGNDNNSSDKRTQTVTDNGEHPIYVINYEPIRNAINNARTVANNVSDYKEGGLSTFFQGCEDALAIDPINDYTWNSANAATNVQNCAQKIETALGKINSAKTADIYASLRNEMLNAHGEYNAAKTDYHNTDSNYTTSSESAFKTAYETAKNEMAVLVGNRYKSTLGTIVTDLQNAHHSLEEKADFSELAAAYNTQINAYDLSNYTLSSVSDFQNALSAQNVPYAHYTDAQKADTGVSKQAEIDAEIATVNSAYLLLDPTKSLSSLESAYNTADSALLAMNDQTVDYTADSLEELISSAERGENYLGATAEEKRDFGERSHGEEIDGVTNSINNSYANLESVSNIDLSAFNAIIESAEKLDSDVYNADPFISDLDEIKNTVYTSLTYTSLSGASSAITVLKSGINQMAVDIAVAQMLTSLNSHIREYSVEIAQGETSGVTFSGGSYSYDNTNGKYTASYGTTVTFRSDSDEAVWYMQYDSQTTQRQAQYQAYGNAYTSKVLGNMYIYCKTPADGNKLTVKREYSDSDSMPVQYIDYVSGEYTLPSAPVLPYYVFDGYYIGGNKVTGNITVDGETEIIAKYIADLSKANYTVAQIGAEPTVAQYNDEVSLTGENDTYAWLELINDGSNTFRPFYIGKDVTFRVTESTTLKAVTQDEYEEGNYALPAINLRQSGAITADSRVTFIGQYVPSANATILEYGVLIGKAKDGGSITNTDVILENAGSKDGYFLLRAKSTMNVGANQFSIFINNLNSNFLYRGYIIYQDSEGVHNVYTDVFGN